MARRADPVTQYARDVLAGRIVAGRYVRLACERHIRDLKDKALVWKPEDAARAIGFFPDMLVLEDGRPFTLEPFQAFIIGSCMGFYFRDDQRRFRTSYVEMGKGNGKSPLAGGLGLYGLIADGEPAAEVYSAATTRDQAKILWKDAARMVEQSAELNAAVQTQVGSLTYGQGVFRPVSSEHKGLDGHRVHMGLIDELHEHPSAIVVDKIRAGTKTRRNALIFEITNSGHDRHSVCWNHHDYSIKVLEGVIDNPSWFAYVCTLDLCAKCAKTGQRGKGCKKCDDFLNDEKCWLKVNPGLGTILPISYVREQVAEAKGMPSKENIVRRLNGCEWTEQSVRAIPMDQWDRGSEAIDVAALKGRRCYGGMDLARVGDLSSFELLFPPIEDGEKWKVLSFFWVPEDDIGRRSEKDRVPYDVWLRQGFLEVTPGATTDFGFIEARVVELSGEYDIVEVAYDRTFAGEIVQNLEAEGLTMVEFGQGFMSMGAPTAELLRLVKAGQLQHGGHPVLRWNASNLSVATDAAGNMKPDKEHSAEKIDGISALVNAIGRGMVQVAKEPSVYEKRGILVL